MTGPSSTDALERLPDEIREWVLHLDLHMTEHDDRHARMALCAAWPKVRDYFLRCSTPTTNAEQDAPINVSFKPNIRPDGEFVRVTVSKGDVVLQLTKEQAQSLAGQITSRMEP